MKLPISWLKKYIDISITPERLSDLLTLSGTKVEHVEKKDGEAVLQIEVTTNRPDCLSLLGLAQEVSALTGKKIKFPSLSKKSAGGINSVKVEIEDKKGCPKYTARLLKNVSIKASSLEIQKFLGFMDTRPISNTVDATNFTLFETGQPLHAFDYDKIEGGVIVVRRAKKGEKFLAIDSVQYSLDEGTLVIADAKKAIAIAGVMGGKLTEVTSGTKSVLLESAYFDPAIVRQASRRYKLFTESSYRFERGVDIQKVVSASSRARDLILEWAGGQEAGQIVDKDYSKKSREKSIILRQNRIEEFLGMKITVGRMAEVLKRLGFRAKASGAERLLVSASHARRDVSQEADFAEEILRIEGFDKVPALLPTTRHAEMPSQDKNPKSILELKKYLSHLGFNEIITYSFLSKKMLVDSGFEDFTQIQKASNALSSEQEYFRPSVLPGMLGAMLFNIHRKASSLKFFEVGNCVLNGKEETVLGIGLYGDFEKNWKRKETASYYDLKGVLENVFDFLSVEDYDYESGLSARFDQSSSIVRRGRSLGTIGVIHRSSLTRWDISHEVIYAEIVLDAVLADGKSHKVVRVKSIPKFPSVRRDIAFIIEENVPIRALEILMKGAASPHLQETELFDQYVGKNIPKGKRSLAFSLAYQKETGTFTDEEITALQDRVGQALKREYQVEFR